MSFWGPNRKQEGPRKDAAAGAPLCFVSPRLEELDILDSQEG